MIDRAYDVQLVFPSDQSAVHLELGSILRIPSQAVIAGAKPIVK